MQKTQLVDKTFNIQLSEKKRKSSLKWATVNAAFLSVIYYDISTTNKLALESELFYYVELAACAILSLSFATNILTFIYYTFFTDKVVCDSESQRFLLNLSNNSILKSPQPKIQAPTGNQNETINIRNLSYQTYSEPNSMLSTSLHNNSWMSNNASGQMKDSSFSMNPETSFADASNFQTPPKFQTNDFIMNRSSMDQYLKEVSSHETAVASAIEAQNNMTGFNSPNFNSFWGNCRFDEIIASLKTSFYQLSPHNSKQNSRDETYTSKDSENNSESIRKMCANKLSNFTANLKMWISKTILEPLVVAIDEVDKAFQQRGFTDMTIGCVGLDRLKKMTQTNQHLIQHIPMLPKLLPFLELTTNQEYMVQRIRELAKGSCMKNFKFNSVTNFAPDQDNIPSDAGIIFHLFCAYLDSQLHPLPDIPRAFYSRYVILGDVKKTSVDNIVKEVSKNKAKCGILCSNPITPKFNFVSDKVHTSSYDRNNLFYVIIQLLMHLKSDGALESVNLGKSGINILNVIED